MDGLLALYIYLLTGLAKFSRPLSVIGFGEYREWHPGEKLKILLVGYNGARNADRWKEKHPEVELNFENWDCYSGEVPEGLDVFVFDTISLDSFAERGFLLALSEKDIQDYNDLIPSFVEGCRVNGTLCVIPQFLCTDLLYTRKKDADLKNVQNIDDLYSVLGDSGLLLEKHSFTSKIGLYLQALIDEKQSYMDQYPPIKEGELSPIATDSLEKMR